jgi:hypothetical protein
MRSDTLERAESMELSKTDKNLDQMVLGDQNPASKPVVYFEKQETIKENVKPMTITQESQPVKVEEVSFELTQPSKDLDEKIQSEVVVEE